MKPVTSPAVIVAVLLISLLSACSSSNDTSSGNPETEPAPGLADDEPEESAPQQPTMQSGGPEVPAQPENPATPAQPEGPPSEPEIPPTTTEPAAEEPPQPPAEPVDEPELGMLIPEVSEGGDLDRLVRGVTRYVSLTLLDLNSRLSQGIDLTDQQETCLGTYDPAVGEQLLAIGCEQPLATGNVPIRIHNAGFYDTSACNSGVSAGNADSCVLQQARITIPVEWIIPELPADSPPGTPQRPQPIAGMEIYYAVDNTNLRIENTVAALTGVFRCDLDLSDKQATTQIPGQSCSDIIRTTADRLDTLLPE